MAGLEQALARAPDHVEALHFLGFALFQSGDEARAVALMDRSVAASPHNTTFRNNLAYVYRRLGRTGDAEPHLRAALADDPDCSEALINLGDLLRKRGRLADAETLLRRAAGLGRLQHHALNGLGRVLAALGRPADAVVCYRDALRLAPDDPGVLNNFGVSLSALGQAEEAVECFERALAHRPNEVEPLSNLTGLLLKCCDWERLAPYAARLDAIADASEAPDAPAGIGEYPLTNLQHCDDPARNFSVARARAVQAAQGCAPASRPPSPRPRGGVIRLGYASCDFRNHVVTHFLLPVLRRHDRRRFHVTAYSYGPDDDSDWRRAVAGACDRFADIAALDDDEAACRIRDDGIDILVDLTGHTDGGRLGIFARRAAPVQVNYLGYPGTTGADFIDHMVVDEIACPAALHPYLSERPAFLPGCFMPCDPDAEAIPPPPARADAGLPAEGFVFCCVNHAEKIDPVIFGAWMRLLDKVPRSLLWLLDMSVASTGNLRREAARAGIDPARLVFAPRLKRADHISRMALADLVLDTRIFNGNASTIAALLGGAPVITLTGACFTSRLSASILTAAGLADLITDNLDAYEALAAALALDPPRLAEIRARLAAGRATAPLFDIAAYVRNLEDAFTAMYRRDST